MKIRTHFAGVVIRPILHSASVICYVHSLPRLRLCSLHRQ